MLSCPNRVIEYVDRFFDLCELQDTTIEINGSPVTFGGRTSQGLWGCLRSSLSAVMGFEKCSCFSPDGAAVMGALQAGSAEGHVWLHQKNVASYWNQSRIEQGLPELLVTHCAGHRANLANRHCMGEFNSAWQKLISRQWHHFDQSYAQKNHSMQFSMTWVLILRHSCMAQTKMDWLRHARST